ncbi:nitroreductase family protein [Stutzerimonas azotifigens]|uniref:nitroreductase family protein n=1 Tax=Stutzerimonas azotifigens TaxID=291995 RepID=UPI00041514D0|nr:nitroreductase [Stutzerimonas azotifigens]
MDALDLLLNRVSVTRLCDPAPDAAQRDLLFRAALRAPDHGQLRPWRFLTVEGEARQALGELFAEAVAGKPDATPEMLAKARKMPLRAPLLVVVVATLRDHSKVPKDEQLLAAGCAAHGMLLAAHALGIGAVWRTGALAYDEQVAAGLGLEGDERIVGYLYLGTPEGSPRTPPALEPEQFVKRWPAA